MNFPTEALVIIPAARRWPVTALLRVTGQGCALLLVIMIATVLRVAIR